MIWRETIFEKPDDGVLVEAMDDTGTIRRAFWAHGFWYDEHKQRVLWIHHKWRPLPQEGTK
jgi:hypothetical protein